MIKNIFEYRVKAEQIRSAANQLVDSPAPLIRLVTDDDGKLLALNAEPLVAAIVGHVKAEVMEMVADMIEYKPNNTHKVIEQNNELRTAAAKGFTDGDWQAFNAHIDKRIGDALSDSSKRENGVRGGDQPSNEDGRSEVGEPELTG